MELTINRRTIFFDTYFFLLKNKKRKLAIYIFLCKSDMYLIDYIQKRMVQTNLRQIIQKLTRNTYRNI